MKKNDLINVKIQDLGVNGEGIARAEGYTFFAPFSLPGEVVEVKALKVKKNIVFGKVERVISPSISRVSPRCPIFFKCGGCQMQHVDYAEQLQVKKATVENCFKKIAGISLSIDKAVPSSREYGYRNKLQLPLRRQSGKNKIGFFRSASHDVVETDTCPIHPKWADDVIACIKDYVGRSGERLYDESDFSGSLRHLVVREINGEFLFTFVVNGSKLKDVNLLIDILNEKFEKFSVYINENRSRDNVILGDRFELVYGNGSVTLTEFGVTYSIGPQAFFQVNTPVKEAIYSDVLSLVDNNTAVIDAYAGAGVLTAMLSKVATKAYGVEIIKEACESASYLMENNGVDNAQVICGDCELILPDLIEKVRSEAENVTLVFDPPRKGVDQKTLLSAIKNPPDKIVYVSCSPQTLARDVGILTGKLKFENGSLVNDFESDDGVYKIDYCAVYDMFPQTKHVESLVCLSRKTN